MSTQYYQKLRDLFEQNQPDIQTVKCKPQSNAFNQLLQDKIQPYLSAYQFVKVLEQNFTSNLTVTNSSFKKIQEPQKGLMIDKLINNLRYFCQKKTQVVKAQIFINNIQIPQALKSKGFDQKMRYVCDQNQMLRNWLIATATQVKNNQLNGKQQQVYKKYKQLKKIVQKQNKEYPFHLLDEIQRFKNITCLVKSTVKEYQETDKTIINSNQEEKIEKMFKTYTNARNEILLVSKDIKKIIGNVKTKKCLPNPSIFSLNTTDKELQDLVKELIKQISCLFKQLEANYKAKQIPNSSVPSATKIKQGVTYQQLLKFVDDLHQEIYSEDEPRITQKMTKIKQHALRPIYEQPVQNYTTDEYLQKYNKIKNVQQQLRLEIEQLMSVKKKNQQFEQILKEIRLTLDNQSEITSEQVISIKAYQSLPQQIVQILSFKADQKENKIQQNTESGQQQNNGHLIEKYIQQHQDERFLYQKQTVIKQLQTKLNLVTLSFDKLQAEKKTLISKRKSQMHEQNEKVLQLQSTLQQERKCIKNLKESKIQLQVQIQRKKIQINSIIQQMTQMSENMTEKNQHHDIQIQNLKEKYERFKKSYQNQIIQSKRKAQEQMNRSLQEIRQNHQDEVSSCQQEITVLREQLQEYKKKYYQEVGLKLLGNCFEKKLQEQKVEAEQAQLKQLQHKYNQKFQCEIQAAVKKNQTLQEQINNIKAEKEQLISKLQTKTQQIKMANEKLISIQSLLLNNQQEKTKLLEDYQKLMDQSRVIQQTIMRHQQQEIFCVLKELSQEQVITKTTPNLLVSYTKALFNQDIFEDNELQKEILIQHLERYASSKISRTKLLYKYDTRNKINFHQYIDDIKRLVLVIKTSKAIIAGFYPQALKDKQILNKGGLLVSVTNNKSYQLYTKKPGDNNNKNIYRGMIYDTFFAIYGNAEIRIKTGFKTVFSNFGVSNAYFNNGGDKIDKFLNEGDKREVEFEYCQFYQVLFENSRFK